uniref:Uncharacterized protein n=1 Tax=Clytia hemisphaerica TaxID=252671 RepID=A0A7M5U9R3_9CNID
MIEDKPSQDSNIQWLFRLELSKIGEKLEHWFYDQLLPLKDDILQDTVVLSSLTFLTNLRKKMHKETDFIIIAWQRKLVISVELKRTIVDEKVFKQLKSSHQIFEERLGDQLKSGWTYFPVVGVENDNFTVNSQHFITMKTEIKPWLTSILNKFQTVQTTHIPSPLEETKDLLKMLIFAIHVSKKDQPPITSSTWVEYTSNAIENVSTSHNILFHSNQQMAIMNNDDLRYKKVMIHGPFGGGKSILLTQKAMQLNKQTEYDGKVMYVVSGVESMRGETKYLLFHRLKVDLEENLGIFVEDYDFRMSDLSNTKLIHVFLIRTNYIRT